MKIPISTLALKVLLLFWLCLISYSAHLDQNFRFTMWYFLPYAVALIVPLRFTDVAAGICLGAVLTELPFALFFSVFGGIFPDPTSLLVMRISSGVLLLIGLSSVFNYRREGSSLPTLIAAAMLTMGYVILYGLFLSAR